MAARLDALAPFLGTDLQIVITYELPRWDRVAGEIPTAEGELPFTVSRGVLLDSHPAEAEAASRFPDPEWAPSAALRRELRRTLRREVGVDPQDVGLEDRRRPERLVPWWIVGAIAGPAVLLVLEFALGLDLEFRAVFAGSAIGSAAAMGITDRRDDRREQRRATAWADHARWRASRLIVDASELGDMIAAVGSAVRAIAAFDDLGHGTADIRAAIGVQVNRGVRAVAEAQRLLALSTEDYALLALLERDEPDGEARALRSAARSRSADLRAERATADDAAAAIVGIGAASAAEARRQTVLLEVTERNRLLGDPG